MPNDRVCDKMLTSKTEIKLYLRKCSDYMFKKYVLAGMPARYEDGRWSASTARIDAWWDLYTGVSMRSVIDQIPDNND